MSRMKIVTKMFLVTILTCLLATMIVEVSRSIPQPSNINQAPTFDYITPALEALDMDELKEYVETFSDFGTRLTGYSGCEDAAEYIYNEFEKYGLRDVDYHYFNVTVPVDEGAYVTLPTDEIVTLYPFWPNMVSPVQTPPGGITGKLIYVGEGEVKDFDGKEVDGSIVLMDMNTQYNWLTAAKYGAKAIIFIEPEESWLEEFRMKILDTAAYYFPRLYVKAEDSQKLISQEGATATLVSNMKFRKLVSRNVIGYLPGQAFSDKYILLTASYDSYSFVPSLAPGAREAIGVSIVLQLAKYFASHPGSNQYTLVFIAFSGTNQGVTGSRWFVREFVDQDWDTWGSKVQLQMNFDIDDVNRFIMPTIDMGWLWGWSEGCAPWVGPYHEWIFKTMKPDLAQKLNQKWPPFTHLDEDWTWLNSDPKAKLVDARIVRTMFGAGGPGHGITWVDQLGDPYRYGDSEPLANLGGPGFTWHNYMSFEMYTYTPFDTPDRIQWENVEYKLTAIYPLVYATINTDLTGLIKAWQPGYAGGIYPKWTDGTGEIAEYNVTRAWYDPVPNAIFMYRKSDQDQYIYAGLQPLPWVYEIADENGEVFLPGLCQAERYGQYHVRAFVLNESTGQITHAPAFGLYWFQATEAVEGPNKRANTWWDLEQFNVNPQTFSIYTVFECSNVVLFDFGDIYFRSGALDRAAEVIVNNFVSHSPVEQTSWECYVYGGYGISVATLHVPPDEPIEMMTQTTYTGIYPFEILTNSSKDDPYGSGYTVEVGEQITITHSALKGAYDWFNLNSEREGIIARSAVPPPARPVETKELIENAFSAIERNDYTELESLQHRLLVLERNQYLVLRATIEDSVKAITFFGLILVPFAFVLERLVGQFDGLKRVIMTVFAYGLPLLVLSYVHPGFALASNPTMLIVGFLVLVLTSPLLGIVYLSFVDALRRLREKVMGAHWIEMGRTSVALLSFSVGVLNMRKRRLRTSLTLMSVLLITVGVVLFTSIGAWKMVSVAETGNVAPYTGIFVHQWQYDYADFHDFMGLGFGQSGPQIGKVLFTELEARYGDKAILAPRAWAFMGQNLKGWFLTTEDGSTQTKTPILAVLGLTSQEADVTMPDAALVEYKGKQSLWFTEDMNPFVTIIGTEMAEDLNVGIGDKIRLGGYTFKIVGVADETIFNQIRDLDGLEYTPMDTRVPGYTARLYLGSGTTGTTEVRAPETIIIPYKTVLSAFKGLVVNIGMKMKPEYEKDQTLLFDIAKEIYTETTMPLYIGYEGTVYTLFPENVVTLSGWESQSAPLIIAALVILNLMLGSIEERKTDIFTLSSVGLSPFHIGFLFFAEALTYAIIGGVGGYLISMLLAPLGGAGIRFQPASTTVVGAVTTMMAVTITVTIYPIYTASKLVTPSLERRWKIPKPKGDRWQIMLPFTATRDEEADGMLAFTHELATGHQATDSEVFRTVSSMKYSEEETPKMLNRTLIFDSQLSPYELGMLQDTRITDVKEKDIGRHTIQINLYRKAGPKGSWVTFGREFVDLMRKQILLWRSFSEEQRQQYQERFAELRRSMKGEG